VVRSEFHRRRESRLATRAGDLSIDDEAGAVEEAIKVHHGKPSETIMPRVAGITACKGLPGAADGIIEWKASSQP